MTLNHMICPACGHDFYTDCDYATCPACQNFFYASESRTRRQKLPQYLQSWLVQRFPQ